MLAYDLTERGAYLGHDIPAELLNLGDKRIAAMDASGIDTQVVSLTMPGCEGFEAETAIAMATDANDRLAEAIQAHPSRLAGLASLPTTSPATAAKELERAVTKLGFKGAMINGHVRGEFLDNQKILGNLRMRPGLEGTNLPPPDDSASRHVEGLLRRIWRTRHPGVGVRDGHLHTFPQVGLRWVVRRLSKSHDDPGPSRRRLAVLDSPAQRPHSVRRQTAGFEVDSRALSQRKSGRHNERELLHARFSVHFVSARRR